MNDQVHESHHCPYCEDGIIWHQGEDQKSEMFRCPFCKDGSNIIVKDLPMLPKKKLGELPHRECSADEQAGG